MSEKKPTRKSSPDFKKYPHEKPFNLWLLEKIVLIERIYKEIHHKKLFSIFSQIRSEVQLLDRFWQRRIEDENKCTNVLTADLTDRMVQGTFVDRQDR